MKNFGGVSFLVSGNSLVGDFFARLFYPRAGVQSLLLGYTLAQVRQLLFRSLELRGFSQISAFHIWEYCNMRIKKSV